MNQAHIDLGATGANFLIVSLDKCMAIDPLSDALEANLLPQLIPLPSKLFVLLLKLYDLVDPFAQFLVQLGVLRLVDEFENFPPFTD
jgi:hypothetical protein